MDSAETRPCSFRKTSNTLPPVDSQLCGDVQRGTALSGEALSSLGDSIPVGHHEHVKKE
ncbi:hypothetical protein PGIGA_G00102900, partial [Pangasianodon gigas]|nr:hypothetical protein [Pangasianodon gigas]